jgi:outer membrane protein TolC
VDKNSWNAGVYISIPLFDGGLRKWERERATREIRRQEEALKALRQEKGRDSAGLFVKLRELDRTIAQYRQLLARYEKLLAIASGAAALGGRSRAELLESGKEALRHRAGHGGVREPAGRRGEEVPPRDGFRQRHGGPGWKRD